MHSYISSPKKTLKVLGQYSIRLRKSLGQNFLIDTNVLKKIVSYAGVGPDDIVLEIGSGIGSLTEILYREAGRVICIEIDKAVAEAFSDLFKEEIGKKIELIRGDALRIDYRELSSKFKINKVVSNLPYKITAPLIIKFLMEAKKVKELFLTIQKDIAIRLLAGVGDKNYSSYTVKSNTLASYKICFPISRNCFMPVPFVDSVMVKIEKRSGKNKLLKDMELKNFFEFVNKCFLHRRKKLVNSLAQGDEKYSKIAGPLMELLSGLGKSENIRAEELDLREYIFLYKSLNI